MKFLVKKGFGGNIDIMIDYENGKKRLFNAPCLGTEEFSPELVADFTEEIIYTIIYDLDDEILDKMLEQRKIRKEEDGYEVTMFFNYED